MGELPQDTSEWSHAASAAWTSPNPSAKLFEVLRELQMLLSFPGAASNPGLWCKVAGHLKHTENRDTRGSSNARDSSSQQQLSHGPLEATRILLAATLRVLDDPTNGKPAWSTQPCLRDDPTFLVKVLDLAQ